MSAELAKELAAAADWAKKTGALVEAAVNNLLNLKGHLDTVGPQLTAVHQKIVTGAPEFHPNYVPPPVHPVLTEQQLEDEETQPAPSTPLSTTYGSEPAVVTDASPEILPDQQAEARAEAEQRSRGEDGRYN
jgi:hypothetical protein